MSIALLNTDLTFFASCTLNTALVLFKRVGLYALQMSRSMRTALLRHPIAFEWGRSRLATFFFLDHPHSHACTLGQCVHPGLRQTYCYCKIPPPHHTAQGLVAAWYTGVAVQLPRAVIKSSITSSEGAWLGSSSLHCNLMGREINCGVVHTPTITLSLVLQSYFLQELLHFLIKLWCDQSEKKMKEFPLCSSNYISITA